MQKSGLALVTIVFLGALARMLAPAAQTPSGPQPSGIPAGPAKASDQKRPQPSKQLPERWYPFVLSERIRDFFGEEHSPDVVGQEPPCGPLDLTQNEYQNPNLYLDRTHWCVPDKQRGNIRFVIATVPDPVHTHLGLFFDRNIDAIEQGASSQGYTFDRAVMPWHYLDDPNSTETEGQAKLRESFPGLMIFRKGADPLLADPPLFVLVVAETPTAGINEEQFHHALEIIHDIRKGTEDLLPPATPEFGILGPTFSGSLYSLRIILNSYLTDPKYAPAYSGGKTLPVYATVMGTPSIKAFREGASDRVRMAIFEEDATVILTALRDFASEDLHYKQADIAVLSEDETSYGRAYGFGKDGHLTAFPDMLTLSFPRGISQFRSEYSKEFQNNSAQQIDSANGGQQVQRNLRLDLRVTGSDDDSVAPYAKPQTALNQEGIMLAILSELRLSEPKFILLRATDPLDELFLARYLRDKYPQGRLVVPSPDLLFPRDEAGQLDGVLGLNTYPLSPADENTNLSWWCGPPDGSGGSLLLFPASSSAALYNAASMLIFKLDGVALQVPAEKASPNLSHAKPLESKAMAANVKFAPGVPSQADSSCGMSPDIWMTIVSRNSIRPIKILKRATESTFFASSGEHLSNQRPHRNTRTPATWFFSFVLFLILLGVHFRHNHTGGTLGRWLTPKQCDPAQKPLQWKAWILWLGGIILVGIYAVLASSDTPIRVREGGTCLTILLSTLLWIPFVGLAGLAGWDFWKRRQEHLLSLLFMIFAVLAAAAGIWFVLHIESEMVFWQQRALDLTSGVSPATPILALLLSLYVWFRYSLRGESLVDWRCPQLPVRKQLPDHYFRLADSVECIREKIRPFSHSLRKVDFAAIAAVACLALTSVLFGPGHVPVRSLEGRPFDIAYSFLLGLSLVALIATLLRMIALWLDLRLMLTGLDRPGMKDALQRLSGFEWKTIWNPAWSVEKEGYKLIAREIQTIERLSDSLGLPEESHPDPFQSLRDRIQEILALRDSLIEIVRGPDECPASRPSATQLIVPFKNIQQKFAETAGLLCKSFLDKSWQRLPAGNDAKTSGEENPKTSSTEINVGTAVIKVGTSAEAGSPPLDSSGLSHNSLRLAEEFVACVYSNFLVTVLLRVRGLVFSAVTFYVCIIFSTISYPFEPAPELNTLAIALFLFAGVTIGYVYEEMHRDPTLSRMTSTDPGKLDSEFWVKFVAAGIAPLVVLVTTVYPPFGHLLYTLVGPLLQALR